MLEVTEYVAKLSLSKPEAANFSSELKFHSSGSHDQTDPNAEALNAQLGRLKSDLTILNGSEGKIQQHKSSRTYCLELKDDLYNQTKGSSHRDSSKALQQIMKVTHTFDGQIHYTIT